MSSPRFAPGVAGWAGNVAAVRPQRRPFASAGVSTSLAPSEGDDRPPRGGRSAGRAEPARLPPGGGGAGRATPRRRPGARGSRYSAHLPRPHGGLLALGDPD